MTDIGAVVRLRVTGAANGGHCVGRTDDGQVVFVRHTLPGELVDARVTGLGKGGRYLLADTETVIEPAAGRTQPMCTWAGRCGGCDYQHATASAQRSLKLDIVVDLLARIGKVTDINGKPVAQVCRLVAVGDDSEDYGVGSRTRVRYLVGPSGVASMRGHHSHDLVPVGSCPLGGLTLAEVAESLDFSAGAEVELTLDDDGNVHTVVDGVPQSSDLVVRRVHGRTWHLQPTGFWQVHPRAGDVLTDLVTEFAGLQPGNRVLDLYAGAGLFAAAAAELVGEAGHVVAVESADESINDGATALSDLPQVMYHAADVGRWLRANTESFDVVVLDPPRAGAGANAVRGIASAEPQAVIYVSCDAATFARDVAAFAENGYCLDDLAVVDLFPMTGHTETVARLIRSR